MKLSIHQPSFFPWLGLLDKIAKCDSFMYMDDVHANKASYQYRNIFYCNGEAKFLSLPVNYSSNIKINELEFKNDLWKNDHLNKLSNYYRNSPYFNEVYEAVSSLYLKPYCKPVDLIIESMRLSFQLYDIHVKEFCSSDVSHVGDKGELVLSLCKEVGANIYLSGSGALKYMNDEILSSFKASRIAVEWHHFNHPEYRQFESRSFVPGLSCLDMLFFEGIEKSRQIFWSNIK